jgi:diacylglycerol kinase family enzyme
VRVTLIHNPGAGSKNADGDKLLKLLEEAGHQVRVQSADDDGWKEALSRPADVVAVAGGDGTVARVAKAMVGRGMALAPLPAGTANNISRTLGLVERPWEELIRAWPEARRVKLDIGVAKGPWGERYFVEGVGAGLFACLLQSPHRARKRAKAKPPDERVVSALERLKKQADTCKPVQMTASLDGHDLSGGYLLFEVLNIAYVGPNLFLAPDSQPGDGNFDVVLVTEAERERLKTYLSTWQENRERLAVLPSHRGKQLRLEWTGFELHIDDELWPDEEADQPTPPATIDLTIAGAVDFLAPDARKKSD